MNSTSAQTTPSQQDTASESDNTWSQESDIRSLKAKEFECISCSDDEDDDEEENCSTGDQKKRNDKNRIITTGNLLATRRKNMKSWPIDSPSSGMNSQCRMGTFVVVSFTSTASSKSKSLCRIHVRNL
jgi:hypothetical protein